MKTLISDMGTEYKNTILTELCNLLKINQIISTAYHHQTLGTVERSNMTFNEYVRSYISINKTHTVSTPRHLQFVVIVLTN